MGRWLWIVGLMLTGCSLFSPTPQGDLNLTRGTAQPESWTMMARVVVQHPQGSDSGRLEWHLSGVDQQLELLSPLGNTVARVTSNPVQTHLILADRREFVSSDPSALTESVLGYAWPLSGLPWWLRGQPDPGEFAHIERDEQQHIRQLNQAGWVIHYAGWRQIGEDWLPGLLTLERKPVRLRIKVDRWVLGQGQ